MRPPVELIAEDDYVWHAAELVGGEGRASERRLSVDEEDGSSSLRVDLHTGWGGDAENYGETGPWQHDSRKVDESRHTHDAGLVHDHAHPHDATRVHAEAHLHDSTRTTHPIPSTLPVRSRSRGGWRGWDGM